jgi:methyltransferase-like protein/2-polyprenyl-3-methyl-5-hydroxy-6-metoxy-1,4-benzoquinol methylase
LATSYDEIPYPRLAFPLTHPSHLATIGRLLGLRPAPLDRCRVLELGCASGANLVPMAYALPGSTWIGIDLSERQIAEGRAFADGLGLTNVVLEQLDICQAAESLAERFGPFDYIIAHGIYSWVPDTVKQALLAACRRLLAPEGIAYVSYNCYPGCQLREMIRRMCQYHGRRESDPRAFAATNRAFLEFLLDVLPASGDPYRTALREQAAGLLAERDAVILHDDLERDNDPQLLHQFLAQAARQGLQYLGDTHFGQMFGIGIDTAGLDLIRQGGDVIDFQQYLDFLYGRALRTTLLCREEVAVRHHLVPAAVRDLWISSSAVPISSDGKKLTTDQIDRLNLDDPLPVTFRADECTTSIASRVGKAAMLELSFAHPKPLAFDAFAERVRNRLAVSAAPQDESLAEQLAPIAMEWFAMRLVELRAFEPPMATEPSARPIASAVARYQTANGWGSADAAPLAAEGAMPAALRGHATDGTAHQVTNLLHRRVYLGGELAGQVLLRLDGRHDRAAIVESLAEPVLSGKAQMRVDGQSVTDPDAVRKLLSERVAVCIADFARNALLVREVASI